MKLAADGHTTALLTLTRGDKGRWFGKDLGSWSPFELATERTKEWNAAVKTIGFTKARLLEWPDGGLAASPVDRVTADVVVLLDDDDGCTLIARHDRRAQPRCARSSNDDVRGAIPFRYALGRGLITAGDADDSGRADAERTRGDELPSTCPELRRGAWTACRRVAHLTVTSTS